MIQAWQKRLLNNKPSVQYDFTTSGTHTQVLDAGVYDISLVGGGGGGALVRFVHPDVKKYAIGGVGGVIRVRVAVPVQTTITINVGAGGASAMATYTESGTTEAIGVNGGTTNITGLDNAILSAGGGSAASLTNVNTTPGVQGKNTISGTNVMTIYADNEIAITSTWSSSTASQRTVVGKPNLNWPENTQKGMGGDVGWSNSTTFIKRTGGVGFVRIKTAL